MSTLQSVEQSTFTITVQQAAMRWSGASILRHAGGELAVFWRSPGGVGLVSNYNSKTPEI